MCNPRFRLKIDLELHTVKSSIEPEHHNVFIPGGGARISIVDSQFAFFMPRYPFFEPAPQVRVSSWEALPVATSVTSLTVATPLDARPGDGEERLCYSNGVLDPQVIPMIFSSAPQAEEVQIEVYEMSKSYDARDYGQQLGSSRPLEMAYLGNWDVLTNSNRKRRQSPPNPHLAEP